MATATQLIPVDVVEAAAVWREALAHPSDAVIIGVDVASGHGTDVSVASIRKGLDARSYGLHKFPGVNPINLAYEVAALANEFGADGIFVDATGVGEGTAARLRELGLPVHPIYLGARSDNPNGTVRCANKRAELWTTMAQWLKVGAIVNDDELKAQLRGPEYSENAQGLVIEKKEHMRERGLASPDCADSLSLTFAYPVHTPAMNDLVGSGDHRVVSEYDPYSDSAMRGEPLPEAKARYYAPGYARLKSDEWSHDDLGDAMASDRLRWAKEEDDGWQR